jgi:hypothetical protein
MVLKTRSWSLFTVTSRSSPSDAMMFGGEPKRAPEMKMAHTHGFPGKDTGVKTQGREETRKAESRAESPDPYALLGYAVYGHFSVHVMLT